MDNNAEAEAEAEDFVIAIPVERDDPIIDDPEAIAFIGTSIWNELLRERGGIRVPGTDLRIEILRNIIPTEKHILRAIGKAYRDA